MIFFNYSLLLNITDNKHGFLRNINVFYHFARSNRVSQIPAILLKNKARQSKMKTRFSCDGYIIFVFS